MALLIAGWLSTCGVREAGVAAPTLPPPARPTQLLAVSPTVTVQPTAPPTSQPITQPTALPGQPPTIIPEQTTPVTPEATLLREFGLPLYSNLAQLDVIPGDVIVMNELARLLNEDPQPHSGRSRMEYRYETTAGEHAGLVLEHEFNTDQQTWQVRLLGNGDLSLLDLRGAPLGPNVVETGQIGDRRWLRHGDNWLSLAPGDVWALLNHVLEIRTNLLSSVLHARRVATGETVNGVQAARFQFSTADFGYSGGTTASIIPPADAEVQGDLWLQETHGYLVKLVFEIKSQELRWINRETSDGAIRVVFDLADIDTPIEIALPSQGRPTAVRPRSGGAGRRAATRRRPSQQLVCAGGRPEAVDRCIPAHNDRCQ